MKHGKQKPGRMTEMSVLPKSGPIDIKLPELEITAHFKDTSGTHNISINNCLELEEQFQTLKSGQPLCLKPEKHLINMERIWNIYLLVRHENWQVKANLNDATLQRVHTPKIIYVLERDNPSEKPEPEIFTDGKKAFETVQSEYQTWMKDLNTSQEKADAGFGSYGCYWNFNKTTGYTGDALITSDADADRWEWRITQHELND